MTEDPTAKLLASMRRDVVPVAPEEQERAQRDHVVPHIDAVARDVRKRRRERRALSVVLAAAAGILLVVALGSVLSSGASRGSVLASGRLLTEGHRVEAGAPIGDLPLSVPADGHAELTLGSDAQVAVAPSSVLRVEDRHGKAGAAVERVHLFAGTVRLSVPKLPEGGLLAVVTPHGSVEVHGTKFRVTVEGSEARKQTSVDVTEGEVHVRTTSSTVVLHAGDRWSSAGAAVAADVAPKDEPTVEPRAVGPQSSDAERPAASAAAPLNRHAPPSRAPTNVAETPEEAASRLAEQNRLYRSAMHAKRNGMDQLALSRLNDLLSRYPGSPLAENAHVERLRILRRLGRGDQAAQASTEYLEKYPRGFAVEEASGAAGRGATQTGAEKGER